MSGSAAVHPLCLFWPKKEIRITNTSMKVYQWYKKYYKTEIIRRASSRLAEEVLGHLVVSTGAGHHQRGLIELILNIDRNPLAESQVQRLQISTPHTVVDIVVDLLWLFHVPFRVIHDGMLWWVISVKSTDVGAVGVSLYHEVWWASVWSPGHELWWNGTDGHGEDKFTFLLTSFTSFSPLSHLFFGNIRGEEEGFLNVLDPLDELVNVDSPLSSLVMSWDDCIDLVWFNWSF